MLVRITRAFALLDPLQHWCKDTAALVQGYCLQAWLLAQFISDSQAKCLVLGC
jgi:hypothetical protein